MNVTLDGYIRDGCATEPEQLDAFLDGFTVASPPRCRLCLSLRECGHLCQHSSTVSGFCCKCSQDVAPEWQRYMPICPIGRGEEE